MVRVTKKRGYHHGDLARALPAAALALIGKKGVEGFTLRDTAAHLGVTHGAAYRHFEDKASLLAAIAEAGFHDLAGALRDRLAAAGQDPMRRLRAFGRAYVEFALDAPAKYRVMLGPRVNESGRFPTLEAAIAEVLGLLIGEMKNAIDLGTFRSAEPRDFALAMWLLAHGYVDMVDRRRVRVANRAVAIKYFLALLDPMLAGMRA